MDIISDFLKPSKTFYNTFLKRLSVLFFPSFRVFITVLLMMSMFRVFFFLYYKPEGLLNSVSLSDILKSFIFGIRFDLQILCYLQILFFIVFFCGALLPERIFKQYGGLFLRSTLFKFYFILWLIILIDFSYFSYFGEHFTFFVFGIITDDTQALITTIWKNYPVLRIVLVAGLGGYLPLLLIKRYLIRFDSMMNKGGAISKHTGLMVLFTLVLLIAGARGSFSLFPLSPIDVNIGRNEFINANGLNGPVMLYKAFQEKPRGELVSNVAYTHYKPAISVKKIAETYREGTILQGEPLIDALLTRSTAKKRAKKPHVVLVVMEGFGAQWLKYDSPEFNLSGALKPHIENDIFLSHFLPSADYTIGSINSVVLGIPRLPGVAVYSESEFLKIPIRTALPRVFKEAGYETRFVYSGKVDWRNMKQFFTVQGFDYIDAEEVMVERFREKYKGKRIKNEWGLYDQYVFEYVEGVLSKAEKPTLIVVLTTTNHPPYDLPDEYQPLPLEIPGRLKSRLTTIDPLVMGRFRTYQYANNVLGQFLNTVKKGPFAQNVIVAFTGDHGFKLGVAGEGEQFEQMRVPFYLYAPADIMPDKKRVSDFGSHLDIAATLINLALPGVSFYQVGDNLFSSSESHTGCRFDIAFSKNGYVKFPSWGARWVDGTGLKPSSMDEALNRVRQRCVYKMVLATELLLEDKKAAIK